MLVPMVLLVKAAVAEVVVEAKVVSFAMMDQETLVVVVVVVAKVGKLVLEEMVEVLRSGF
jgi:hypothetical protein